MTQREKSIELIYLLKRGDQIECRNDKIKEHRKHIFYDYEIGQQVFYSRSDAVKEIRECDRFATYPGGSSPALLYYKSEKALKEREINDCL